MFLKRQPVFVDEEIILSSDFLFSATYNEVLEQMKRLKPIIRKLDVVSRFAA